MCAHIFSLPAGCLLQNCTEVGDSPRVEVTMFDSFLPNRSAGGVFVGKVLRCLPLICARAIPVCFDARIPPGGKGGGRALKFSGAVSGLRISELAHLQKPCSNLVLSHGCRFAVGFTLAYAEFVFNQWMGCTRAVLVRCHEKEFRLLKIRIVTLDDNKTRGSLK
mmetsp:Transcript_113420/g.260227  ORF Transcript_113420/g.260227 Transcript_113420/m.260227 type:complete len:164 (+) Transcript_113420:120-611(+)